MDQVPAIKAFRLQSNMAYLPSKSEVLPVLWVRIFLFNSCLCHCREYHLMLIVAHDISTPYVGGTALSARMCEKSADEIKMYVHVKNAVAGLWPL